MKKFAILSVLLLVAGMASAQSDECATAVPIGDGTVSGDTTGFTGIDESSCTTGDTNDGWYLYTATCTGNATASTCNQAAFDTSLSAFDSCGGVELGCNDDGSGCAGFSSLLTFPVTTGTSYLVRVAGYNGTEGTFDLTMSCSTPPPPPANDDCGIAELVGALPFSATADNTLALPGTEVPSCNSSSATESTNDIWYMWTIENVCDFSVTVATVGYDSFGTLYSGSCGTLTEVDCSDPSPMTFDVFGAQPGTTYYLQIGDWGTTAGVGGANTIDITEVVAGSCGVVPVELVSFAIE